jgi:hypothetical protein
MRKSSNALKDDRVVVELRFIYVSFGDNVPRGTQEKVSMVDRDTGHCGLEHVRLDYRSTGVYCYKLHLFGLILTKLDGVA